MAGRRGGAANLGGARARRARMLQHGNIRRSGRVRPLLSTAHFITPDWLAGRAMCWPEMRLPKPVALAVLFHNLDRRL